MPLSAIAVKNAKPREKPYKLADEKGLYLLVRPNGGKWWRLDYRFDQRRKTLSCGVYPDVGLAEARQARDAAKELLAAGTDPSEARRQIGAAHGSSVAEIGRAWHKSRLSGWTEKYADTVINRLERNVFPFVGEKPIADVTRADVLEVLRRIEERGAITAARRVRAYLSDIFEYAKPLGLVATNPTADLHKVLKAKPRKKSRAKVRTAEIPQLLAKMASSDEDETTRDALRLTLLTAVRTVETRFAHKDEFEDLDGDEPLWRLSPERMKMFNEHLVPLSRQAAELVRKLVDRAGATGLLFERKTVSGTISENTMLYALYRMGYHGRATVHGFRGMFSTWANEQGFNSDWIERQLAHVPQDEVRGAYNSALYLPGRRRLLQAWADFLDAQAEDEFNELLR